jgi:hypothetical protein
MPLFMNLNILFYLVRIKEKYILSKFCEDISLKISYRNAFSFLSEVFRMLCYEMHKSIKIELEILIMVLCTI